MDLGGTADEETRTSEEVSVKRAKHFHPERSEFQVCNHQLVDFGGGRRFRTDSQKS